MPSTLPASRGGAVESLIAFRPDLFNAGGAALSEFGVVGSTT
jgi:hypothetical protein